MFPSAVSITSNTNFQLLIPLSLANANCNPNSASACVHATISPHHQCFYILQHKKCVSIKLKELLQKIGLHIASQRRLDQAPFVSDMPLQKSNKLHVHEKQKLTPERWFLKTLAHCFERTTKQTRKQVASTSSSTGEGCLLTENAADWQHQQQHHRQRNFTGL